MVKDLTEMDLFETNIHTLTKILNHSSDEIFVLDRNQVIVFVNKTCEQHYGLKPHDVLGKNNSEFVKKGYWSPSIVDAVFEKKRPVTITQTTYIGSELMTTAIPILNQSDEIELVVITATALQSIRTLKKDVDKSFTDSPITSSNIITNSAKMKSLLKLTEKIAPTNSTVLILGESGTGKGVMANQIHLMSQRKARSFLTINCAAIPEELMESELFGYTSGAFTGAEKAGKKGLIESANHGTVFLDEIGEISLKMQTKLLQLIQDHQFIPVGGRDVKRVDVRFIAATNQNLEQLVKEKKFREDLYYRLNVFELEIPPLRQRPEDIIPLIYYFLNTYNRKYKSNQLISQEAIDLLSHYSWPGNIRQLQNIMERAVVTADTIIQPENLPQHIQDKENINRNLPPYFNLDTAIEDLEKKMILEAYKIHSSTRNVAKELGISQTRASRLIRKYKDGE